MYSKSDKLAFIEAYKKSGGRIAPACRKTGISRQTIYDWMAEDSEFAETMAQAKEIGREDEKDFVENSLLSQIKMGNFSATKYYLDAHAKDRGYGQADRLIVENDLSDQSTEDLAAILADKLKQLGGA